MNTTNLKEALWLMRFEMRHSLLNYVILAFLYTVIFLFFITSMTTFDAKSFSALDYNIFLFLFALPAIVRFQPFKHVHFGNYMYVAPFHILANQLPINRSTYIAYHLSYRFVMSAVITSIFLSVLYPFINTTMSFSHYIIFILLWTGIAYTIHLLDAYTLIGYHLIIWIFAIFVGAILIAIAISLLFFVYLFEDGFFFWTLEMTERYPIYTLTVAILLFLGNILFWQKLFSRRIKTMDLFY